METSIKLHYEKVGKITVALLSVDALTIDNVDVLNGEMEKLMEPGGRILLDLSLLRVIDSTGIGLIRCRHKKLTSSGGQIYLSSLTKQVLSVFKLIKLDRILHAFDTREDALRSFG